MGGQDWEAVTLSKTRTPSGRLPGQTKAQVRSRSRGSRNFVVVVVACRAATATAPATAAAAAAAAATARASIPPTTPTPQADNAARRTGTLKTQVDIHATGNRSAGGIGPMGTSAGAGARKIEDRAEEGDLSIVKVDRAFSKALQQARLAKKMNQKALATAINEKPQVIGEYESGKAVPNPQIISKIERTLGCKLPKPPKKKKPKK